MKRGDIIARDVTKEVGEEITGSGAPEVIIEMLKSLYEGEGKPIPKYKLIPVKEEIVAENPGLAEQVIAVLEEPLIIHEEAVVNWVIDGAAATQHKDGSYRIFELVDEPDWKVIVESVPSYQSSVENMTDEDLRKAIDDLRSQRTFISSRPKRVKVKGEVIDKNDPLAVALASMPQDKKAELMKKLGMVD